ncbi:MAG TPA: ATP-binding protein [Verrucomicrobiae bacterium]|nr:ATP-binding protein [Verrucomicrobiae bacterium]
MKKCLPQELSFLSLAVDCILSSKQALKQLDHTQYDLCILDARKKPAAARKLLLDLCGKCFRMPVICVTAGSAQGQGMALLRAGAKDYLSGKEFSPGALARKIQAVLKMEQKKRLQKRTETDIQRAHRRNEQFLASITSILIGIRRDGTVTYWNQVAEKTFGIPAHQIVHRPFSECTIAWDLPLLLKGIKECMQTKKSVKVEDVKYRKPDGEVGLLGFTLNPLSEAFGSQSEVLVLGADITDRRAYTRDLEAANQRIAQEKAKAEAILASIGEGLVVTDKEGRIVLANKQAIATFHWHPVDIIGQPLLEQVPLCDEKGRLIPADRRPTTIALMTGRRNAITASYGEGANMVALQILASPVLFDGKAAGVIVIFRDITREKEIDKTKTEFISTVSHELRTPLTSIREGVAQVSEEILGPINADQKEFLGIALEEVDRLAAIINDLLDISKIEAGKVILKKAWVDLKELVEQTVFAYQSLMKNKSIDLAVDLPEEMADVFCDSDKVKQVLTNLLTNAYKFTPDNGRITVHVQNRAKEIQVNVRDTGIGINEENLPKLFNKFVQVGRTAGPGIKGTGLGLAICKNLVEMHDGQIGVESQQGEGSCFYFTLPRLQKDSVAQKNIDQGLEELGQQAPNLSVMVLKLTEHARAGKADPRRVYEILKPFSKWIQRRLLNGIGDIFLNGFDESMVVLPGMNKKKAVELGERLKASLEEFVKTHAAGRSSDFEIAFGISTYPEDADTSENLLSKARPSESSHISAPERRGSMRLPCRVAVTIQDDAGEWAESETVNLGQGGFKLYAAVPYRIGAVKQVELRLPLKNGTVRSKAVVVWVQRDGKPDRYLVGFQFVGISEAMKSKIKHFIEEGPAENGDFRKTA